MEILENSLKSIINLSDSEWNNFKNCFSLERLSKGEHFALEGRKESNIGFIIDGVLRAYYRTSDGIEYNKTFFTKNDFFGAYAALVTGQNNKINIQALTEVTFLKANYKAITDLFEQNRGIETLARKIAELFYISKENREIELALLQADARYSIFKKQYPNLENLIPQYHVASYLGITPTQLSRIRVKK